MQLTDNDLTEFWDQYLATGLWADLRSADDGETVDTAPDNAESLISTEDLGEMKFDCLGFIEGAIEDLVGIDAAQAGHDFWLSRNRHGAGFWDRGLGDVGDRLHEAAKVYGTQGLMLCADGTIEVHG